jgi:hypothetical protein
MRQDPVLSRLYQAKDDLQADHVRQLDQVDELIRHRMQQLQGRHPRSQTSEQRPGENVRKAKALANPRKVAKGTPGIMHKAIETAIELIGTLDRPVRTYYLGMQNAHLA